MRSAELIITGIGKERTVIAGVHRTFELTFHRLPDVVLIPGAVASDFRSGFRVP